MFLTWILIAIYVLIAAFSALMTYDEHRQTAGQTAGRSPFYAALGFLACAFWPITFLVVAVAARRQTG